jgi:MinD-like ATPase involved in chromosome partitioning or flagellar assembly
LVGGGGGGGAPGGTGLPARLLVVTGTDPIGLAAGYALVKAAVARTAALPGGPVAAEVIVNRHDDDAAHLGHAQIAEACGAFLGRTVRLAGALPDDGCLERALRAGMPLQDAAAGSPAAVAAQAMVERLLADLGSAATQRGAAPQRRPNPYVPPSSSPSPRLSGAVR